MYGIPRAKPVHAPRTGGKISGPGTGTSDSIKAEVPAGTYIMPADSTEQLGFGVPKPGAGQVPVNLSNGEYELPPEQVHAFGVRALNQMKNATHKPTGQPSAAGGELFFADGGLVDDPEKRRAALTPQGIQSMASNAAQAPAAAQPGGFGARFKQTSFDATNTPAAPLLGARKPVPGSPARAAAMQAQFDQPVTGPRTPQPSAAKPIAAGVNVGGQPGLANDMADGLAGAGKAALGVAGYPALAAYDGVRNAAGALAGGDTSQIEQYRGGARNLISEGVDQMSTASANLRERTATATRDVLGIEQAPAAGASLPKAPEAAVPAPAAAPAATAEQQAAPQGQAQGQNAAEPGIGVGWARTGHGVGATGGEIAMRRNERGQAEFTNETASPDAVAGARAMPAGGFGVPRSGASGEDLAGRGSAANVGNGVGTFSQMEAGSSQEALARFERANEIRAGAPRARELGDNGGKVTVVRDSTRAPTLAEVQNARLESRLQQDQIAGADAATRSAEAGQRMSTEQLQQQKLQQDLVTGQYGLEDQQRLADLRAQISDPSLGEDERAKARQAYNVLATQAKDRYITQDVVLGQGNNGPVVGKQVLDVTTGQPVAGQAEQPLFGLPQGVTHDRAMSEARAAIASGVPREAVNERLRQWGIEAV